MTRLELDQIAWQTIHERPAQRLTLHRGGRPLNYLQMDDQLRRGREFELAWSDFLHAFYEYKHLSFFEHSSPLSLNAHYRALLAGAAEWLSAEFHLPHPAWTEAEEYFLKKPWDPWQDLGLQIVDMEQRVAQSPHAFRRRNICYEARDLLVL